MRFLSGCATYGSAAVLVVWICALMACGEGAGSGSAECPAAGESSASEACVRLELGVPAEAERVMILSQSSHLDWDWLATFDHYYQHAVDHVFSDALDLLSASHFATPRYYYSIAEMGYLQRFVQSHPDSLERLRAVEHDLRIVGGGITSPDNLLPNGETFIRDYLVGKTWLDQTLGLPIRAAWIPDDFGHDAQLPISLSAMGLGAVGFARVPDAVAVDLMQNGVDFVWQAADGSEVQALWMPDGYCQGDRIDQALTPRAPPDEDATALARMHAFFATNGPVSRTPYVFVPVGCDFARPKPRLLEYVRAWNEHEYPGTGVWAVAATFDHYAQLVAAYRDRLPRRRFDATPYWTGFYASRPLIKILYHDASRALLGAEVFGTLADAVHRDDAEWIERVVARAQALHHAWDVLVPGNHHDYVTGTALDAVYQSEQTPRLREALSLAEGSRDAALDELAASVAIAADAAESGVIVFNPLGFERSGLVELPEAFDPPAEVRTRAGEDARTQASAEGGLLFRATVPSMGYDTVYLRHAPADEAEPDGERASLIGSPDGEIVVLENASVRAVVSRESGWGLTSLVDKATGEELIAPGEIANAIVVYADQGGLYRFGHEMPGCSLTPAAEQLVEGLPVEILETGPLRVRIRASLMVDGLPYERTYMLIAGEAFLRMSATGAAPPESSVMVEFPFAGPVDEVAHGTPYHWDTKPAQRAAYGLTFDATHDFLIPRFQGAPRAALFHGGIPAWAVQGDGTVVGALWRNARLEQCAFYGAYGTDPDAHTVSYALRVPSGIEPPESGRQLREARSFQTAILARAATGTGRLPERFSLASVTPEAAILTAAKSGTSHPNELVLRIYQPTNAPLSVEVRTASALRFPPGGAMSLQGRTALETPLDAAGERALGLRGDPSAFTLAAQGALTTVAVRHDP